MTQSDCYHCHHLAGLHDRNGCCYHNYGKRGGQECDCNQYESMVTLARKQAMFEKELWS